MLRPLLRVACQMAVNRPGEIEKAVNDTLSIEGEEMVAALATGLAEKILEAVDRFLATTQPDDIAVIGSSNMDMRSFSLNKEISLVVRGASFVDQMRQVEEQYRSLSRQLTIEEWSKQPLRSTVLDGLARLTSALQ